MKVMNGNMERVGKFKKRTVEITDLSHEAKEQIADMIKYMIKETSNGTEKAIDIDCQLIVEVWSEEVDES